MKNSAAQALRAIKSEKRAATSKANGAKGGRPVILDFSEVSEEGGRPYEVEVSEEGRTVAKGSLLLTDGEDLRMVADSLADKYTAVKVKSLGEYEINWRGRSVRCSVDAQSPFKK